MVIDFYDKLYLGGAMNRYSQLFCRDWKIKIILLWLLCLFVYVDKCIAATTTLIAVDGVSAIPTCKLSLGGVETTNGGREAITLWPEISRKDVQEGLKSNAYPLALTSCSGLADIGSIQIGIHSTNIVDADFHIIDSATTNTLAVYFKDASGIVPVPVMTGVPSIFYSNNWDSSTSALSSLGSLGELMFSVGPPKDGKPMSGQASWSIVISVNYN